MKSLIENWKLSLTQILLSEFDCVYVAVAVYLWKTSYTADVYIGASWGSTKISLTEQWSGCLTAYNTACAMSPGSRTFILLTISYFSLAYNRTSTAMNTPSVEHILSSYEMDLTGDWIMAISLNCCLFKQHRYKDTPLTCNRLHTAKFHCCVLSLTTSQVTNMKTVKLNALDELKCGVYRTFKLSAMIASRCSEFVVRQRVNPFSE